MRNSPENQGFDKVIAFRSEIEKESDRGCALMSASVLSNELKELLLIKLVGLPDQKKMLFEFSGLLGTFAARINLSYAIGLISKEVVDDLNIIKDIRNSFGHEFKSITLEDSRYREDVLNLGKNLFLDDLNIKSRAMFVDAVCLVLADLQTSKFRFPKFVEAKYFRKAEALKNIINAKADDFIKDLESL